MAHTTTRGPLASARALTRSPTALTRPPTAPAAQLQPSLIAVTSAPRAVVSSSPLEQRGVRARVRASGGSGTLVAPVRL